MLRDGWLPVIHFGCRVLFVFFVLFRRNRIVLFVVCLFAESS